MDEQNQRSRRRRGVLAALATATAIAVALPVTGAVAGDDAPPAQGSGEGNAATIQDQRDQGPRDRDYPEKDGGQDEGSGAEAAIEL